MSRSNWLCKLAVSGCLILALSSAVLAQKTQSPPESAEYSSGSAAQEEQPKPSLPTPEPKVPTSVNQEASQDAEYYARENLDAQRRMAVATEELVNLTSNQIIIIAFEVVLILLALGIACWAAWEARMAANHSRRAANTAEKTLASHQRPWLSVVLRLRSSLVFKDGEGRITIDFIVKNYGSTPALNVEVEHKIAPFMWQQFEFDEITKQARNRRQLKSLGHKIFPNDEFTFSISIPIAKADIEAAIKDIHEGLRGMISPLVMGCVVYNSPFDDENHITEFNASLGKIDPTNPKIQLAIPAKDGEVPLDQLKITLTFGSGLAD